MSTAFKGLVDALATVLLSDPPVAGGFVHKNKLQPIPAGRSQAVVVRIGRSRSREVVLGQLDWTTLLAIECHGRGLAGSDPADAVDPLLADVWARLASIPSSQIDAMGLDVNAEIEWEFDDGEAPLACATIRMALTHRTATGSLTP